MTERLEIFQYSGLLHNFPDKELDFSAYKWPVLKNLLINRTVMKLGELPSLLAKVAPTLEALNLHYVKLSENDTFMEIIGILKQMNRLRSLYLGTLYQETDYSPFH